MPVRVLIAEPIPAPSMTFYELIVFDNLVKSCHGVLRWLDKKFDIQGAVFLAGLRLYR